MRRGTVVVLTGASSGTGRATALELAAHGASLVLAARDVVALQDVARECRDAGAQAIAIVADVARERDVEAAAELAVAQFGRIDVWINDAAVAAWGTFEVTPSEVFRRVFEVNFFGVVHGARAALRRFRQQRRGILINVDSAVAGAPQPYTTAYVGSKYAVRGFSAALRMDLAVERARDIHVCTVLPSGIDTPLFQHAANDSGRVAKALDPVYAPRTVARAIAALIDRPRPEVVVGGAGKIILAIARRVPRVSETIGARAFAHNHLLRRRGTFIAAMRHAALAHRRRS